MKTDLKKKKTFLPHWLYILYEQKCSNLRPLLFNTFPQGFRKSKKFGYWTLGNGGKNTVKLSEKHQYQEILLSKAKFAQKLTFLSATILHPFLVKVFESEATVFHYFPLKNPNLWKIWTSDIGKVGPKNVETVPQKWTDRQTHRHTNGLINL